MSLFYLDKLPVFAFSLWWLPTLLFPPVSHCIISPLWHILIVYLYNICLRDCALVSTGNTSELHSQRQRDTNSLWPGKSTPQRRCSESHGSVSSTWASLFACMMVILLLSGYVSCHAHNFWHHTEHKISQSHFTAGNVSRLIRMETATRRWLMDCKWLLISNHNHFQTLFLWCRTSEQTIAPIEAFAKVVFELELQVYG